jgi:formylglycine-generating enzyme required for sulfatase activity
MRILSLFIAFVLVGALAAAESDVGYGLLQEDQQKPGCGCGSTSRSTVTIGDTIEVGEPTEAVPATEISSIELSEPVKEVVKENMAFIPGGRTFMGTNTPILKADGEGPMRMVTLSPYFIDRFTVTNEGCQRTPMTPNPVRFD